MLFYIGGGGHEIPGGTPFQPWFAKEEDEMFCLVDGVSINHLFDLFDTIGEGFIVSGATDLVREQVVDMQMAKE